MSTAAATSPHAALQHWHAQAICELMGDMADPQPINKYYLPTHAHACMPCIAGSPCIHTPLWPAQVLPSPAVLYRGDMNPSRANHDYNVTKPTSKPPIPPVSFVSPTTSNKTWLVQQWATRQCRARSDMLRQCCKKQALKHKHMLLPRGTCMRYKQVVDGGREQLSTKCLCWPH